LFLLTRSGPIRRLREHDSRKISLQQEFSADFFLLNVFLPAEALAPSC
jgi:hypothetical protein